MEGSPSGPLPGVFGSLFLMLQAVSTRQKVERIIVEPDYFQFYVRRVGAPWLADQVSDGGYARRLWSGGAFAYVGTLRKFGSTPVDVVVHPAKPDDPDGVWQHVAEVSLEAGDPTLEVFSWGAAPDAPTAVVEVPAAPLRLRASWAGLEQGRFEGMDDNSESGEHLFLELWSEPLSDDLVIRSWPHWA